MDVKFAAEMAEAVGAEHVVAGIDTKNGRIAVKGWKAQVALTADEAIPQLEPYAAAYLYTHVDGEGMMQGFPIEVAARCEVDARKAGGSGASRRSMNSTRWEWMRWRGWRSIRICWRS